MDPVTRRTFLLASGVAGGAAIAAGGMTLAHLLATGDRDRSAGRGVDTLVVVTLYGGNDGLNTVVPYADDRYRAARPDLAYAPEEVLHLDDSLGFNPALTGLKRLWDARRVAVVLGVGYPRPDRSHFRSMDIWQTASPGRPVGTGWIGRWLDGTGAAPEVAVSFEPVLPPLLGGERRAGACVSLTGLRLPGGLGAEQVELLGRPAPNEPASRAQAAAAFADLLRVDRLVREAEAAGGSRAGGAEEEAPATATGGEVSLAAQLHLAARCIEAGVPTRVYSVSLGGFDTHADERRAQERLLRQLDQALTAFVDRLAAHPAGRRVAVLVYSEFGRRVRANASSGTDHGTAGPLFVLGPGVAGGRYGEQPSLADLDDGDLKVTTDFRDVYATLLGSVLGADPARYLEGYRANPLPLFGAGGR
jgi:uncharacterized protein (DUF1501 family)